MEQRSEDLSNWKKYPQSGLRGWDRAVVSDQVFTDINDHSMRTGEPPVFVCYGRRSIDRLQP